jgi:hypothetical protein
MSSDSPTPSQRALPVVVRDALAAISGEAPPEEREFSARLHRRLVAANAPRSPGWRARVREAGAELWRALGSDTPQKRSFVTGAIGVLFGALATATAFLLLSGAHPFHGAAPSRLRMDDETSSLGPSEGKSAAPGADRKGQRAAGDRRPSRDRLGEDIGAERPERLHPELAPGN